MTTQLNGTTFNSTQTGDIRLDTKSTVRANIAVRRDVRRDRRAARAI